MEFWIPSVAGVDHRPSFEEKGSRPAESSEGIANDDASQKSERTGRPLDDSWSGCSTIVQSSAADVQENHYVMKPRPLAV